MNEKNFSIALLITSTAFLLCVFEFLIVIFDQLISRFIIEHFNLFFIDPIRFLDNVINVFFVLGLRGIVDIILSVENQLYFIVLRTGKGLFLIHYLPELVCFEIKKDLLTLTSVRRPLGASGEIRTHVPIMAN